MRRLGILLVSIAFTVGSSSSILAQSDLIEKREAKLASEWLKNASWTLDFDAAKKASLETGKPIFGYFTRSYAP